MQSKISSAMVMLAIAWAHGPTASVQRRPHDQIMREVGATFRTLNEKLNSGAFSDAVEDATRLQGLFGEIEDFWAVFETQDAIEMAQTAQRAAVDLINGAGQADSERARRAYSGIQSTCGSCHDSHRESMPDGSFRIKP